MSAQAIGWRAVWHSDKIPPLQMPEGYELVKIKERPGQITIVIIRNRQTATVASAAIRERTGELLILSKNIRTAEVAK